MADEKIKVRIFFKTDAGPTSVGQYQFTADTLKQLRQDFLDFGTINQQPSGAYDCEVRRPSGTDYVPTVLMLRFSEILYIG